MSRESRIGGSRRTVKVPGQGQLYVFKIIGLSFSLCDLSRFHEYIGRVIGTTRESNIATTSSCSSLTVVTPLTSIDCVGAFPTPHNMCLSSDDLKDAILGPLTLDFADEVIDTGLSNGSTDIRSGLMDGGSCASTTRRAK